MDVPEYYVVHGYDKQGSYLFRDLHGGTGSVHHGRLGDTGIGVHKLLIVRPVDPADDRTTVRQALQFALEVAAGRHGHGGEYATGLAGYDRWIAALAEPEAMLADSGAGFGLAYNASCWAECRRHAAAFLAEARQRLGDRALDADLEQAGARYAAVAAQLGEVARLYPFTGSDGPAMQARLGEADRREPAVLSLRAARQAEADGLQFLQRAAVALGATPRTGRTCPPCWPPRRGSRQPPGRQREGRQPA
jgi:hypothetical protein